ncbi:MAG: hypothetical protein RSC40_09480, partial [Clostridia bacterium]
FARRAKTPITEVLALTKPGVIANLNFTEALLNIHIIEPPKDFGELPLAPARRPDFHQNENENGNDPFVDTDLPVDLR